jgi:hypothetical protein
MEHFLPARHDRDCARVCLEQRLTFLVDRFDEFNQAGSQNRRNVLHHGDFLDQIASDGVEQTRHGLVVELRRQNRLPDVLEQIHLAQALTNRLEVLRLYGVEALRWIYNLIN